MNPGDSLEPPGFFFLPFSSGTAIHADGDEHKKRRGCPFEGAVSSRDVTCICSLNRSGRYPSYPLNLFSGCVPSALLQGSSAPWTSSTM